MIEIHAGENGGFYLHDPRDLLRFGPSDFYNTPEAARVAASLSTTKGRERIRDLTPGKVAKPIVTRRAIAAGRR